MSNSKDTVGGWTWYVGMVKNILPDGTPLDYKELFKKYIAGVPWDKAL
jgi:hypothetical protein